MIAVRFAEWVLSRVVPATRYDSVLGDLQEARDRYRARGDRRLATARYLGSISSVVLHYARYRLGSKEGARPELHAPKSLSPKGSGSRTVRDLRHAFRAIRKHPGFALTVIATLALGIGANTAIFSVVHAVVLRPLPYEAPDELVSLWMEFRADPDTPGNPIVASEPEFMDIVQNVRSFEGVAGYWTGRYNLTGGDEPIRVSTASVSANFLSLLRTAPVLGRGFAAGEDRPGATRVAVLTHPLWSTVYGSDPEIEGKTAYLDGRPFVVVGVLGPDFEFPGQDIDVLVTNIIDPQDLSGASSHYLSMLARLRPGVSIDAAQSELQLLSARQGEHAGGSHGLSATHPAVGERLQDQITRNAKPALAMLFAAAGLLLLIACTNVGNLLFIRAESRMPELSLRRALGADRLDLVRQTMTESLVLATIGGALGTALALYGVPQILAIRPGSISVSGDIAPNLTLLGFAAGLSILTALVAGLAPALRLTHPSRLEMRGRAQIGGASRMRVRNGLLALQLCVSVLLLVGAGVVTRNLAELVRVEPGFETADVTTFAYSLDLGGYPDFDAVTQFHRQLDEMLHARGEIAAAGVVRSLPLTTHGGFETVALTNGDPAASNDPESGGGGWNLQYQVVGPGYFDALGIPLLEGRALNRSDRSNTEPVALINETAARLFWPTGDAIGNSIRLGTPQINPNPAMRVVGIVGDVHQTGLSDPVLPMVFTPSSQAGANYNGLGGRGGTLVVRSAIPGATPVEAVREVFRALDPDIPVSGIRTMDAVVRQATSDERFTSLLLGLFAVVALLLTGVGVYGLMAYRVARRTSEIGVRIALGATPGTVTRSVVTQSAILGILGAALGLLLVWTGGGVLEAFISLVSAKDPWVLVAAPLVVLVTTAVAALFPALRASRIDPLSAIRAE